MMNKRQAASMIRKIAQRREAIGSERDKLRDMIDDLRGLEADCEEAVESLDLAIDALSRLA